MMERWALWPTLVLICLLTLWRDGQAKTAFTIDWVKLSILPKTTVERGTNLTLRCEAKVSHSAPQFVQTFRFLLSEKVIYSKNTSDPLAEYSLAPARASNTGLYKCQVQIEKRSKDSDTLKLTVTGLQTPQLKVQPTVVNEGDEVMATCSAPEETGNLLFTFYKKNQELPIGNTNNNSATIILKAQELGIMELHCNYGLMIHPTLLLSKNSTPAKILVKELDITPSIKISPNAVVEGDRVHISCNVSGYRHGDLELFLTKTTLLTNDQTSFTYSFQATAEASGEYVCKAEKGNVQKISTAHLEVAELFSRPLVKLFPKQVFEGQHFSLNCWSVNISQSRITTTVVQYSLYKDQYLLKQGNTFRFLASKASNGNYTCVAEANGINKTSKPLIVHFKVPVSVPVIRAVGQVIIGQPFQLLCESEHGTLPITYTLLKSNRSMAHMTISEPRHSAVFNISSIAYRNEIHSFSCQAQNQGLHYSKSSQVLDTQVIETVSKPELTLELTGNMATEDKELILYCSVQQGTVPINFTWYREGHAVPLYSTSISKIRASYTMKSITRDHKGSYYCKASNDANETMTSLPVDIGVNLAAWKKIVTGVSCIVLFVFIVIILVIFCKKAQPPRKQKRAVELSVKSKSNDPMRMSLTLDIEDNTAINATPCIMGRNVWGEQVSSSDDEQSMEEDSEKVKLNDVPTPECEEAVGCQSEQSQDELPVDPVMEDTDHIKGEICTEEVPAMSTQLKGHPGSTDQVNQPDLEYVQLNHSEQETA